MRRACGIALALLLAAAPARAWFEAAAVGTRAFGLAGSFVSAADDASAVYWNPAGLVQLGRHELLASFDRSPGLPELGGGFAALALHAARLSFGVGWQHIGLEDAVSEDIWSLSVAATPVRRSLGAFVAGGATFKIARVGLSGGELGPVAGLQGSDTGVCADLGLLLAPIPNVVVGAIARNLGHPSFDLLAGGSSTRLESEFEWGASLRWRQDAWLHVARAHPAGGGAVLRAGAEIRVASALGVRVGVAPDAVTGGFDLRFGRWSLESAFRAHEELGMAYRAGLRLAFGPERATVGGQYDEF